MPSIDVTLLLARATALLGGALLASYLLRNARGSTRHGLWTATFGVLLVLPLAAAVAPQFTISVPPLSRSPALEAPGERSPALRAVADSSGDHIAAAGEARTATNLNADFPTPTGANSSRQLVDVMLVSWITGALIALSAVIASIARAARLIGRARRVTDPAWLAGLRASTRSLGMASSVELRVSREIDVPLAGGMLRPVILIPQEALAWGEDRREVVLTHELVHVQRRDAWRHVLARLSLSLYWFHPFAWYAVRASATAREQACDESVIDTGVLPSRYARHLLDLADQSVAPSWLPALARLEHASLTARITSILRGMPRAANAARRVAFAAATAAWCAVVVTVTPIATTASLASAAPMSETNPAPESPAAQPVLSNSPTAEAPMPKQGVPGRPPAPPSPSQGRPARLATAAPPGCGAPQVADTAGLGRQAITRFHMPVGEHWICAELVGGASDDLSARLLQTALPAGTVVVLELRRAETSQRMLVHSTATGNAYSWSVDGAARDMNAVAMEWRDAMLTAVGESRANRRMEGESVAREGRIVSMQGERVRLRGMIVQLDEPIQPAARSAAEQDAMRRDLERRLLAMDSAIVRAQVSQLSDEPGLLRDAAEARRRAVASREKLIEVSRRVGR